MRRAKQVGIWSEVGSLCNPNQMKDQPSPLGEIEIDPKIGVVKSRVPRARREDSRQHTILKFHHPSSLDYRARHGLPVVLDSVFQYLKF